MTGPEFDFGMGLDCTFATVFGNHLFAGPSSDSAPLHAKCPPINHGSYQVNIKKVYIVVTGAFVDWTGQDGTGQN